nr:zinc finger, CCHC-type [Tanacetum cinerariifolium]
MKTLLYGQDTLNLEDMFATLNFRELQKTTNEDQVSDSGADGYDSADVMMAMSVEKLLDRIIDSGGLYHMTYKRDYLFDFEEYGGEVYKTMLQGYNNKMGWLRRQTSHSCLRSSSSAIEFKTPVDILGFLCWLANIKQEMLKLVKVKCIFLGYHEGTGSVQVLQRVEFEVEPREDHAFEMEPLRNVSQEAGSQKYREDSNEAAFAVAIAKKIYIHESLTFNDIVSCEAISMWYARLKEDMDVRPDVHVLSNACKKRSDDINDYY